MRSSLWTRINIKYSRTLRDSPRKFKSDGAVTSLKVITVNCARHAGISGSRFIAPLVFNLGTKWGLMVSFRLRSLYLKESIPVTKLLGKRVSTRVGLGVLATTKIFCFCRESKYDPSSYVQPVALDTTPIILSGFTSHLYRYFNSVYVNSDYRTQGVMGSVKKYRCGAQLMNDFG